MSLSRYLFTHGSDAHQNVQYYRCFVTSHKLSNYVNECACIPGVLLKMVNSHLLFCIKILTYISTHLLQSCSILCSAKPLTLTLEKPFFILRIAFCYTHYTKVRWALFFNFLPLRLFFSVFLFLQLLS